MACVVECAVYLALAWYRVLRALVPFVQAQVRALVCFVSDSRIVFCVSSEHYCVFCSCVLLFCRTRTDAVVELTQ